MKFLTSDVNGTKVSDFICTPLTSLARSKTHAFVIFSYLGATGAATDHQQTFVPAPALFLELSLEESHVVS
jgi:hypothetical protein